MKNQNTILIKGSVFQILCKQAQEMQFTIPFWSRASAIPPKPTACLV